MQDRNNQFTMQQNERKNFQSNINNLKNLMPHSFLCKRVHLFVASVLKPREPETGGLKV